MHRFKIATYKELTVYRDIHIQCDKAYYSVPFGLRGEKVMARITKNQVCIFHENKLCAVHLKALLSKRRTQKEHYPPDMYTYLLYDIDYCLKKAKEIGENILNFITSLPC